MLKKLVLGFAALLVVAIALGFAFQEQIMIAMIKSQIGPEEGFDAALVPPAPDYASDEVWAALPNKVDSSDERPQGVKDGTRKSGVAVFFIHPTSYINKANWNQPLDDEDANWIVDNRVLRHQASVFSGCCHVYAPRYRQATFFSFLDDGSDGEQALDVAYGDVENAFDEFLSRIEGSPFILAGHSQGTRHAAQLLRERIAGTDLEQRMIAAYLIGFSIEKDQVGGTPLCVHAEDTQCVVGWNVVLGDGAGLNPEATDLICTNPLSWLQDGEYAEHILNDGAIGYPSYMVAEEGEDFTLMVVEPEVADAECINGNLSVRDLRSESFPSQTPGGSLHVYDYSLYYMNIRDNVMERIEIFKREKI